MGLGWGHDRVRESLEEAGATVQIRDDEGSVKAVAAKIDMGEEGAEGNSQILVPLTMTESPWKARVLLFVLFFPIFPGSLAVRAEKRSLEIIWSSSLMDRREN